MTQAERTRTIKYVLAESSRWLLRRRWDTKEINMPRWREKKKKRKKRKTKNEKFEARHKSNEARKSYSRRFDSNKSSRHCYKAGTGTFCHTICHLLPALVGNGIPLKKRYRRPPWFVSNCGTKISSNDLLRSINNSLLWYFFVPSASWCESRRKIRKKTYLHATA